MMDPTKFTVPRTCVELCGLFALAVQMMTVGPTPFRAGVTVDAAGPDAREYTAALDEGANPAKSIRIQTLIAEIAIA